jgi:hypothetical protein
MMQPQTSRSVRCPLRALLPIVLLGASAVHAGTTEEIIDCYKMYSSTYFCDIFGNCSMKWKLAAAEMQYALRCARENLKCQLEIEAGEDATRCFDRADRRCSHLLEKLQVLREGKFVFQRDQTVNACGSLSFADDILAVEGGIGFANNQQPCDAIGINVQSVEDVIACSDAWLRCEVEKLVALITPRAQEVLGLGAWDGEFAPSGCMEPALQGDTAAMDKKRLFRCQARLQKFGRRFVREAMVAVADCVDELFICELRGESCDDEQAFCTKRLEKTTSLQGKFELKASRRCAEIDVTDLSDGLSLGSSGHACSGAPSVEALMQCLATEMRCAVDEIIGFLKPRAAELLDDNGFLDQFACMQ